MNLSISTTEFSCFRQPCRQNSGQFSLLLCHYGLGPTRKFLKTNELLLPPTFESPK